MDVFHSDNSTVNEARGNWSCLRDNQQRPVNNTGSNQSQGYADPLAWRNYSDALTAWTLARLVNRDDVYGRYVDFPFRRGRQHSYTAPSAERRFPGALTFGLLRQHYQGQSRGHLIGVHSTSTNNTSKWLAIDLDHHGERNQPTTNANFNAALVWQQQLVDMGFTPLLMDSNGNGGLHLITFFQHPAPTPLVHHLGQWLIKSFRDLGLPTAPETFPKQPRLSDTCRYGNWLRLPGLHHSRDHWTKIYRDNKWQSGAEAIEALLEVPGDDERILQNWCATHPIPVPPVTNVSVRTRTLQAPNPPRQSTNVRIQRDGGYSNATNDFLQGKYKDGPHWNDRLFRAACDLAGLGFSRDDATIMLLHGAAPYDAHEEAIAHNTIHSAFSEPRIPAREIATAETRGNVWVVQGIEVSIKRQRRDERG